MWKLIPKNEATKLVRLCNKAGLKMLWATEEGAFIVLHKEIYEDHAEAGSGEVIVWLGDGEPLFSSSIKDWTYLNREDLDRHWPNWRE